MPWCDRCDRYVKPDEVTDAGAHDTCGETVDVADQATVVGPKAPWHFKLMLTLLVLYLGWRLIEFGIWIVSRI